MTFLFCSQELTNQRKEHLSERLQRSKEAAAYLNAAMEDGDVAVILLALRDVAEPGESGT